MKKILISQCLQCNSYDSHDVRCRITGSKLMNPYIIPIDCPLEDDPPKNTDWIPVTEPIINNL